MNIQSIITANIHEALNKETKGKALVEYVCQQALLKVRIMHDNHTSYVSEDLGDLANVEADTMRKYRGRYIFELLQNANDGAPFQEKDVLSIYRWGESSKNPNLPASFSLIH
jgi:hypothetical protein